jgi:hypothetical protein
MPQIDKFDSTITSGGTHTLPSLAGTRTPFLWFLWWVPKTKPLFFGLRPTVYAFPVKIPSEIRSGRDFSHLEKYHRIQNIYYQRFAAQQNWWIVEWNLTLEAFIDSTDRITQNNCGIPNFANLRIERYLFAAAPLMKGSVPSHHTEFIRFRHKPFTWNSVRKIWISA